MNIKVKTWVAVVGVLAAMMLGAAAERATAQEQETPCLEAADVRTYTMCMALWGQPSYNKDDGSGLSSPTGSEIIAELAEEGITPGGDPRQFRAEAQKEIREYFDHARG